jgi:PAS domain S-box-containing protein
MNLIRSIRNLFFPQTNGLDLIKDDLYEILNTKLPLVYWKLARYPTLKTIFISNGIRSLLGIDPSLFYKSNHNLAEIIHPEDFKKFISILDSPKGTRVISEVRLIGKNQNTIWTEVHIFFGKNDLSLLISDISERVHSESKILESEERLLITMKSTGIAIWEWDVESSSLIWKTPPNSLLRLPIGSINDSIRSYFHLIHPDDFPDFIRTISSAMKDNDNYNTEHRIIDSNGIIKWVEAYAKIFRDSKGKPIRWLGTLKDITDRKNLLIQLQESESRARRLFESSVDGIFLIDEEGTIIEWNRIMERLTKISRKNTLGKKSWIVLENIFTNLNFIDKTEISLKSRILEVLKIEKIPEKGLIYEYSFLDKSGKIVYFLTQHFELKYSQKSYIITYVRDITENKIFEKETNDLYLRTKNQSQAIIDLASDESFNNGSLDLSLKNILSLACSVLETERSSIWMFREDLTTLECIYEYNKLNQNYKIHTQSIESSKIKVFINSLLTSRVIVANSINKDSRISEFNAYYSFPNKINSLLIASIRVKGKIVGIICIEYMHSERVWKSDEIMFAGLLSDQTAIAIINSERKQNEDQIKLLNTNLEKIVDERTQQLRSTNIDLSKTLSNLSKAQNQLVQSEKMAALGQLIAGIAHEINNPIGSIKASLELLRNNNTNPELSKINIPTFIYKMSNDQINLAEEFFNESILNNNTFSGMLRRQKKHELEIFFQSMKITKSDDLADKYIDLGIDYISSKYFPLFQKNYTEDLLLYLSQTIFEEKNYKAIEFSLQRVANIIRSLKTYSHNDNKGEKTYYNVKDSIETVLTILNAKLKRNIEIIKNFDHTPNLKCYPDDLIQLWTNLIMNSAQAINFQGKIEITINYIQDKNLIKISIVDSGEEIPFKIREKIFNPFFTTKKLGEGSGLGLDICQKIVQNHDGKIYLADDTLNTTFIVELPIQN